MKKQTKHHNKIRLWIFIFTLTSQTGVFAQSVELNRRYVSEGSVKEVTIPYNKSFAKLYVDIRGGDGGNASAGKCRKHGGDGATIRAVFKIGNNDIPAGSVLRFVRGFQGESDSKSAGVGTTAASGGGGGGSAVLYRRPGQTGEDKWVTLAVAGGGGGAYSSIFALKCMDEYDGKAANTANYGGNGGSKTDGGDEGKAGESYEKNMDRKYSGGSGAIEGASFYNSKQGYPRGGDGGNCKLCRKGGFGFGGGGAARYGGGGGGGYSGGGAGVDDGAGGGGSFLHSLAFSYLKLRGTDGGGEKEDGHIRYEFAGADHVFDEVSTRTFRPTIDATKCMDVYGSETRNGTRIQLWECNDNHNNKNQRWFTNGYVLKSHLQLHKCLDLKKSKTNNGNDIQLWDCNGTKAQRWIYDGVSQQIRYLDNWNKCIDFSGARTYNGTKVQIWDCHDGGAQKWTMNYAVTALGKTKLKKIHLAKDENKCLDLKSGNTGNKTSIVRLSDCKDNDHQKWLFDGINIRYYKQQNKCLDLALSKTDNGTDIRLWDCNGSHAQQWVYEGMTGTIRSRRDPDKCLQVENGKTAELYDCHNLPHQQWIIKEPCSLDTTPPVAKCRNFTYGGGLIAPTPDTIDNGSYDDCGITSRDITHVSGDIWKLTVKDKKGNTSSCTATIKER